MGNVPEVSVLGKCRAGMRDRLRRTARRILREVSAESRPLSIVVLPRDEMRALKRRFSPDVTVPKLVDVLAFSEPEAFPHPEARVKPLGEIYLNQTLVYRDPEVAMRRLVHGIAHLLGFNHEKKRDILKMERMEKELWQRISS